MREQPAQHRRGARRFDESLALGVLMLGLVSCATSVQTDAAPVAPAAPADSSVGAAPEIAAVDGARAFRETCAPCHGEDGRAAPAAARRSTCVKRPRARRRHGQRRPRLHAAARRVC